MTFFAGLFAAIFLYLAVGFATGWIPAGLRFHIKKSSKPRRARQVWLNQAGAAVTPQQFWGISLGIGVATFVLLVAITRTPTVALVPAVTMGALPRLYFARVRRLRSQERAEAWPDALRSLVASISASQSLHQALRGLSTGGPVPLRPIFLRYAQLCQTLDQRSALEAIKEELADPVSDRVVEVLIVATDAGPSIVLDIMRELANAANKDVQLADKLETAQTEQRINAKAVFVLPFVMLILLVASNKSFRTFYSSALGLIVILFGSVFLVGGLVMVTRLGKLPVEPRVFGADMEESRA